MSLARHEVRLRRTAKPRHADWDLPQDWLDAGRACTRAVAHLGSARGATWDFGFHRATSAAELACSGGTMLQRTPQHAENAYTDAQAAVVEVQRVNTLSAGTISMPEPARTRCFFDRGSRLTSHATSRNSGLGRVVVERPGTRRTCCGVRPDRGSDQRFGRIGASVDNRHPSGPATRGAAIQNVKVEVEESR